MFHRLRFHLLLLTCIISVVAAAQTCPADEDGGTITGNVTYTANAAHPWRYQRYYVKGRDAGPLAEAVVALRGSRLKNWPAANRPQTAKMDQLNFQFVPETLAIRAGDSVTFSNSDAATHNVKSDSLIATFSNTMGADGEFTHTFKRAGGLKTPAALGCNIHGGMRAWIYVFDHPFFAVTEEDGSFRFENVPPGKYTLEMIHPAGQLRWKKPVAVTADGELKIAIDVSPDYKTTR